MQIDLSRYRVKLAETEAARMGATGSGEAATGYYWGEPRLHPHVQRILERAIAANDERLEQLARRFLR